jgi:hypothetical protein
VIAEDHANAILDMIEGQIATAINLGLQAPLEARIERLLPRQQVAAAPALTDIDANLEATKILKALRLLDGRRLDASEHQLVATAKDIVRARITISKDQRRSA